MKERPILFSGEMARATLGGRKTQTRRVVNPQPQQWPDNNLGDSWLWHGGHKLELAGYGADYVHSNWTAVEQAMLKISPYVVGQRLWVKETFLWRAGGAALLYRADFDRVEAAGIAGMYGGWKPSIFMPRRASRITLEITAVRVERLQEITEDDAEAEGVLVGFDDHPEPPSATAQFQRVWDSLNGKTHPWASNPFVWVVEFKRIT